METQKIQLTAREGQLRNLLLDAARYIDESKVIKERIELRWAGGWVRDKLLGLQSHDVDVAINTMTGVSFCEKMQEYLKDDENMKKQSLSPKNVRSLHKILANPDKSKHLETANTRLYDFDLDFVNLRKETYSEDSRNPQMEFGTPEEDALRRDATINALFYNLHTDLVEDFTGGLQDLKAQRIRTPLEPFTTFKDDPLRVLRLIRFASRLSFTIDEEVEASMSNSSVLEALKLKISRERIGMEIQKMLKGNNPASALRHIDRLGLYSTIFTDPTSTPPPASTPKGWHVVYDVLEALESRKSPGSIYQSLVRSDDERYYAWVLAALTPLCTIQNRQSEQAGSKLPLPYATNVARGGIKANNQVCNVVTAAFRNYESIKSLSSSIWQYKNAVPGSIAPPDFAKEKVSLSARDSLGMLIRKWDSQGGHWRIQVLFALLAEAYEIPCGTYESSFGRWQSFIDHLEGMDLMDAPSIKPIMDGKRLQADLNADSGPWMKEALEVCMAWQLRNSMLVRSDPEKAKCEAVEEVRGKKEELQIPFKASRIV